MKTFYRTMFLFIIVGVLIIGSDLVSLSAGTPMGETDESVRQSTFYKVYFDKQKPRRRLSSL